MQLSDLCTGIFHCSIIYLGKSGKKLNLKHRGLLK